MKRYITTTMLLGLLTAVTPPAFGALNTQRGYEGNSIYSARGTYGLGLLAYQDQKKEEADAYKAWYDANAAKDYPKAIELAKQYIDKFPQGSYVDYLKNKWIPSMRGYQFNQAMQAKNTAEMIKIGKEALAQDADNVDYLYLLALNIRQNELFATPPNFSHSAEAMDFSQRTIKLIEAGKVPAVVDKAKWNQNLTLSWLYQIEAMIENKNGAADKALDDYLKSASLDAANPLNYLMCGSLRQNKYQAAAQKFSAFPEADRQDPAAKPEVKAALDEVNKQADGVIDCWAHFLALTEPSNNPYGATRDQVKGALEALYKFRHPDSPDGLQKLIDQYKGGASANSKPAASTTGN